MQVLADVSFTRDEREEASTETGNGESVSHHPDGTWESASTDHHVWETRTELHRTIHTNGSLHSIRYWGKREGAYESSHTSSNDSGSSGMSSSGESHLEADWPDGTWHEWGWSVSSGTDPSSYDRESTIDPWNTGDMAFVIKLGGSGIFLSGISRASEGSSNPELGFSGEIPTFTALAAKPAQTVAPIKKPNLPEGPTAKPAEAAPKIAEEVKTFKCSFCGKEGGGNVEEIKEKFGLNYNYTYLLAHGPHHTVDLQSRQVIRTVV